MGKKSKKNSPCLFTWLDSIALSPESLARSLARLPPVFLRQTSLNALLRLFGVALLDRWTKADERED